MDSDFAKRILDLNEPFGERELKVAYYREALRHHPDKNHSEEAANKFKEINEAYTYLRNHLEMKEDTCDRGYLSMIKGCIQTLLPDLKWDDLFVDTTIGGLLSDYRKVSLEVFRHLSKGKALEIYSFLATYRSVFHLSDDTLKDMLSIIHRKNIHDNIILLNPTVTDLLSDQIYKLDLFGHTFYVPLWHNEVIFDISGNDLIVKNIPELENNIVIDNQNHIHLSKNSTIQYCLEESALTILLGQKVFHIPTSELFVRSHQIYILHHSGILLADHNDLYNTDRRGHIFIHLSLS